VSRCGLLLIGPFEEDARLDASVALDHEIDDQLRPRRGKLPETSISGLSSVIPAVAAKGPSRR